MNELYKMVAVNNRLLQQILYILIADEEQFYKVYSSILRDFEVIEEQNKKEK